MITTAKAITKKKKKAGEGWRKREKAHRRKSGGIQI